MAISKDTLSQWIKTIMSNAGMDMNRFKTHSTRSASKSAATSLTNGRVSCVKRRALWVKSCVKSWVKKFHFFTHKEYRISGNTKETLSIV